MFHRYDNFHNNIYPHEYIPIPDGQASTRKHVHCAVPYQCCRPQSWFDIRVDRWVCCVCSAELAGILHGLTEGRMGGCTGTVFVSLRSQIGIVPVLYGI